MVLAVCRGVLADPHDANDAFEAAILYAIDDTQLPEDVGPVLSHSPESFRFYTVAVWLTGTNVPEADAGVGDGVMQMAGARRRHAGSIRDSARTPRRSISNSIPSIGGRLKNQ